QVNEEAILAIESFNSEERIIEFSLPEGAQFSEEITKKLNMENVMIDTISVVENSRIRIEKKESNNALGKVFIATKMTKSGDFEFEAKCQHENTEMKSSKVNLSVLNGVKEVSDENNIEQSQISVVEKTEDINGNSIVVKESKDNSVNEEMSIESDRIVNNEEKPKDDINAPKTGVDSIENPGENEKKDIPFPEYAVGS
ncbi:cell surface protein, partial [Klebsiella pneumoniae]|nr:cell surface protein [Klebsiella pneumoniae]